MLLINQDASEYKFQNKRMLIVLRSLLSPNISSKKKILTPKWHKQQQKRTILSPQIINLKHQSGFKKRKKKKKAHPMSTENPNSTKFLRFFALFLICTSTLQWHSVSVSLYSKWCVICPHSIYKLSTLSK